MNTIPTIFNEKQFDLTIMCGKENKGNSDFPVSVLLLNSGGSHKRLTNLSSLVESGFTSIISIETNELNYDIENYVQMFPTVKFLIPREEVTTGDLINIAMSQINTEYLMVIRDTFHISAKGGMNKFVAGKILNPDVYCIAPRLMIDGNQSIPVYSVPDVKKGRLTVDFISNCSEVENVLYPYDFVGVYNRKKFIALGGYDHTIKTPYWQNLDLSMRAWLWGEKIKVEPALSFSYLENLPVEETVNNECQMRFYIKNLLAKYKVDHAEIPVSSFFSFISHANCGFVEGLRYFGLARNWVSLNKFRFTQDAVSLVSGWSRKK
ncbi:MAG: hypothetical protein MJ169_00260 [Treponema sp.]|nr:hypothetical protein [Treponema sp.]